MKTAAPLNIYIRNPGRSVMLIGGLGECDDVHFGGTQYAKVILKQLWGLPPALDMEREKHVQSATREIVNSGLAESAHDLSDGGLAVTAAECCAETGALLDLDSTMRPDFLLFHEAPSRVLISTAEPDKVAAIAARHGVEALRVGVTIEEGLEIRGPGFSLSVEAGGHAG
jgi:phosphoribosylformylglycinamidine (FGAM) synthase-like enzyme